MAFRGARREPAEQSGRPHRRLSAVALAAVLVALSVVVVTGRATGSGPTRCESFAADSVARAGAVSGAGEDLLVIGDSWTAGLGLDDPTRSWTARLPGRVHDRGALHLRPLAPVSGGSGPPARSSGIGALPPARISALVAARRPREGEKGGHGACASKRGALANRTAPIALRL